MSDEAIPAIVPPVDAEPVEVAWWWPFTAPATLLLVAACLASVEISICFGGDRWLEVMIPLCVASIMLFSTEGEISAGLALGAYGLLMGGAVYWFVTWPNQDLLQNGLVNAGSGAVFGGAIDAVNRQRYVIGLVAPVSYMGFVAFQLF